jgi:hypothetical protein
MKSIHILMLASIALTAPTISHAQVAGSTLIGVSVAEMRDVSIGWSAKRQILGQAVFNDKDERIGSIDDMIIAPDRRNSLVRKNDLAKPMEFAAKSASKSVKTPPPKVAKDAV